MRILIFFLLAFYSCDAQNKMSAQDKLMVENTDSIKARALLQVSFEKDDFVREELVEKLKPLSINYKKLNSIKEGEWMSVDHKNYIDKEWKCEIWLYKKAAQINKIIVRKFGKKSQKLQEYYLIDEQLSLVKENEYNYEDQNLLKTDSYFINDVMVYQFDNQDCGAPNAQEYTIREERRIKAEYNAFRKRFFN